MMIKKIAAVLAASVLFTCSAYADYSTELEEMVINNMRDDYISQITYTIGSDDLKVGDETVKLRFAPEIENGNTLAAPEDIAGYFGTEFIVNGDDFTFRQGVMTAVGTLGSKKLAVTVDGVNTYTISMPCAAQAVNGVVLLPLRTFVEDVLAGSVIWRQKREEIILSRDYQTKRIIVRTEDGVDSIDTPGAKEKITDGKGIWIVQFDSDVPDLYIKNICTALKNNENVRYAIPDIVL